MYIISKLEKYRDGELDTPPKLPRRLANLPHVFKVLADRGFDGDNLSYPFFNIVVTPEFPDHETKSLRCPNWNTTERFASSGTRVRCFPAEWLLTEKMLGGVIPYTSLSYIENAHCWARPRAGQPTQTPPNARFCQRNRDIIF